MKKVKLYIPGVGSYTVNKDVDLDPHLFVTNTLDNTSYPKDIIALKVYNKGELDEIVGRTKTLYFSIEFLRKSCFFTVID